MLEFIEIHSVEDYIEYKYSVGVILSEVFLRQVYNISPQRILYGLISSNLVLTPAELHSKDYVTEDYKIINKIPFKERLKAVKFWD